MGKNSPYQTFMKECLKTDNMKSCADIWQSEKSNTSDIDASNFPILPFGLGAAAAASSGIAIKKFYNEPIPFIEPYVPAPWNTFSTLGMIALGAASFVGGVLSNAPNLKSGLLGAALGFISIGVYNGITVQSFKSARAALDRRFLGSRPRLRIPVAVGNSGKIIKGSHDVGVSCHGSPTIPYLKPMDDPFVQKGSLIKRDSGLIQPVDQQFKYSGKIILA